MKVVATYSVELTEDERATLTNATEIIGNFLDEMMDNKCSRAICKYGNHSYSELETTFDCMRDIALASEIKS